MFKKYFAHEFKNTCQMPLTICGVIVGLSILFCIGALLKLEFLLTLGIAALVVCAYACSIMSYVSVHKTLTGRLFTKSGYLTLTLPINTHTILISKILVNFVYASLYFVSFFLGILIVMFGFGILDVNDMLGDIALGFVEIFENLDLVLIYGIQVLIGFVFLLCFILFCYAFSNSGYIKKRSKGINFLVFVVALTVLLYVMNIRILPFALTHNVDTGYKFILYDSYQFLLDDLVVIDFSTFFWILAGTISFYFGSYYLIKNKIDIL
jgi:hypothetical protein